MDPELTKLLSQADRVLGRLDGIGAVLPNPDLFVAMYVRQEAVLSSQIEGTQSTLEDVLQFEVDETANDLPKDVEEVVNYVAARNHGIKRLEELPLSLRLIREIHSKRMAGVRGPVDNATGAILTYLTLLCSSRRLRHINGRMLRHRSQNSATGLKPKNPKALVHDRGTEDTESTKNKPSNRLCSERNHSSI